MRDVPNILLISPAYFCNRYALPPPGIGYIASCLEEIGCKVRFIDCQITPKYKRKILSLLPEYPVVGISVNAGNVSSALEIAKAIRNQPHSTRIIMGGPHATAAYDILIPEYADIVVRGEGEDTIAELMQQKDLFRIKGIAYWDGQLKVNPPKPYIEDLDRIKFPAWHLYELEKYHFGSSKIIPFAIIITSRGCPHGCIYCTKSVHGYKIRLRSIENVLSEVDYLVNRFGIKEISFADDNLTFYPERFEELCNNIIIRNYKNICFSILIDPNFGDLKIFKLMAQARFHAIDIAVESGSQEVLSKLGRIEDFKKLNGIIKLAKQVGLKVTANFLLGLPFDTVDSMKNTLSLAKSLPIDEALFFIAIPFLGTKFYEMVKKEGRFLYDLTTTSISYNKKPVYEIGLLKAKDVQKIYMQAYREFYLRPRQIWVIFNNLIRLKSLETVLNLMKESTRLLCNKLWLKKQVY